VKNNVSMAATKLLVEHCPDAWLHYDNCGWLPLFYAIVVHILPILTRKRRLLLRPLPSRCLPHSDLMTFLAEQCPEMLELVDPRGRVLFHDLCDYQVPVEIVERFVRLCPSGLCQADNECRLPLHYALENKHYSEMVQLFLEGFPRAVTCRDKPGRLLSVPALF
jgi:hypothetical protein